MRSRSTGFESDRLRSPWPVTAVEIGRGLMITLSDPFDIVKAKLGAAPSVPEVGGANLVRLSYPHRGVELLATGRLLATCQPRASA